MQQKGCELCLHCGAEKRAGVPNHMLWGESVHTQASRFLCGAGLMCYKGAIRSAIALQLYRARFAPPPHSANVICLGKTKSARFFSPKRCGSQSCAGSPLTSVDFRSKPEMGYYLLKMKMISCRFRRRCKGMGTSIFATIQKRVSPGKLLSSSAGRCVLHCAAMSCVVSPHFASSFRRALGLRSLHVWDYMERACSKTE